MAPAESLLYLAIITVLVLFPVPAETLVPFAGITALAVLAQAAAREFKNRGRREL